MAPEVRPAYREKPWPVLRNALIAYLNIRRPNSVQGFIEMDVTDALLAIHRVQRELRIAVSFHAYMLHCLVRALILHPGMVSYRRGNKLINFEDIDVLTPIEKRFANGLRIPTGYIVRGAQAKCLAQLNWELRRAIRAEDIAGEEAVKFRRRFARWPSFMRRMVTWRARRDPFFFKRLNGTIILTNVQTHGFSNAGTVFGHTVHTFAMALGTITDRLRMEKDGTIVNRKILMVAGTGDHDIVDGMTATRFIADMTRFVEAADSLDDAFIAQARQLIAQEK